MIDAERRYQQETSAKRVTGSLDAVAPADQMRAIEVAMQTYFGAKDWLRERRKKFPGLVGQYRLNQRSR